MSRQKVALVLRTKNVDGGFTRNVLSPNYSLATAQRLLDHAVNELATVSFTGRNGEQFDFDLNNPIRITTFSVMWEHIPEELVEECPQG